MYHALQDAIREAESRGTTLATVALEIEARDQGRPVAEIRDALRRALEVMRGAIDRGLVGDLRSNSGLVGGDAAKLRTTAAGPLADTIFREVLMRAIAVQEVNAAMGVIVAAPTAGGAGVLPGVLLGLATRHAVDDDRLVDALATAGLIGAVVAQRASLSGAEGGCQAETGAAAGMALRESKNGSAVTIAPESPKDFPPTISAISATDRSIISFFLSILEQFPDHQMDG